MKLDTTHRTLDLLKLLSHDKHRVEDLAKHYQVTTRTIYRDINTLAQAGYAVQASNTTPTAWSISRRSKCPVCGRRNP